MTSVLGAILQINAALDGTIKRLVMVRDTSIAIANEPPVQMPNTRFAIGDEPRQGGTGDTLEDVMQRERGLSRILTMSRPGQDSRVRQRGSFGAGSGRTEGSGHGSLVRGRSHERYLATLVDGKTPVQRYNDYVRASNRYGMRGGRVMDFRQWLAAGSPGGDFEFGGYVGDFDNGNDGSDEWGDGFFGNDGFLSGYGGSGSGYNPTSFSSRGGDPYGGGTGYGGGMPYGPSGPGRSGTRLPTNPGGPGVAFPMNNFPTYAPPPLIGPPQPGSTTGSSSSKSVYTRDDAAVTELKAINKKLDKNGGIL